MPQLTCTSTLVLVRVLPSPRNNFAARALLHAPRLHQFSPVRAGTPRRRHFVCTFQTCCALECHPPSLPRPAAASPASHPKTSLFLPTSIPTSSCRIHATHMSHPFPSDHIPCHVLHQHMRSLLPESPSQVFFVKNNHIHLVRSSPQTRIQMTLWPCARARNMHGLKTHL